MEMKDLEENFYIEENFSEDKHKFSYKKKLQIVFGILISLVWIAAVSFYIMTDKEYKSGNQKLVKEKLIKEKNEEINKIKNMTNTEKAKRIQTILKNKYAAKIKVDGIMGKNTYAALKKYTDIDKSDLSAIEKQNLTSILLYLEGY